MAFVMMTSYSFDPEINWSKPLDSWDEAVKYLTDMAKQEHQIDVEENGWRSELQMDETLGRATITNQFADHTDVTSFIILDASVFPPHLNPYFGKLKVVPHPDKTLEYPGIVVDAEFNGRSEYGTGIWVEEGNPETMADSEKKELHVFVYSPTFDEPIARVSFPGYEPVDAPEDIIGSDGSNAVKTHFGVLTAEPISKRGIPGVQIILTSRGQRNVLVKMFQYAVPSRMDMTAEFQILIYDKNKSEPTQVYTFREPVFEPITMTDTPVTAERLIADLGNGEPTLAGDRTSRYFKIARGCGEKANQTIEVAIVEQEVDLPETRRGYALHLIDNITMKDCQTFYTEHLNSEELDNLLKTILLNLKKDDVSVEMLPEVMLD